MLSRCPWPIVCVCLKKELNLTCKSWPSETRLLVLGSLLNRIGHVRVTSPVNLFSLKKSHSKRETLAGKIIRRTVQFLFSCYLPYLDYLVLASFPVILNALLLFSLLATAMLKKRIKKNMLQKKTTSPPPTHTQKRNGGGEDGEGRRGREAWWEGERERERGRERERERERENVLLCVAETFMESVQMCETVNNNSPALIPSCKIDSLAHAHTPHSSLMCMESDLIMIYHMKDINKKLPAIPDQFFGLMLLILPARDAAEEQD